MVGCSQDDTKSRTIFASHTKKNNSEFAIANQANLTREELDDLA